MGSLVEQLRVCKRKGVVFSGTLLPPDYGTRLQPREVIWLEVEWSLQKFHRREPLSSLIPKFRESLPFPAALFPFPTPAPILSPRDRSFIF